ncbi:MAG: ATP-binding protein [Acidobacteriota bacterium]
MSAPKLDHDRRVLLLALLAGLPGTVTTLVLLWYGGHGAKVVLTVALIVGTMWLGSAFAVRRIVVRPLQTLSNLLGALREEDFSFRARAGQHGGALGEALAEVNLLADTLKEQRLGALEATALLRKVMEEIDVTVLAFDAGRRLRLANRAAEALLGEPAERLEGRTAHDLGVAGFLDGETPRVVDASFSGGAGRFELRIGTFRQRGLPHHLLVLSNVSRTLREEERQAWRRLIRVLGHELNNSLAPIKSIAGSLASLVVRTPRPPDADDDMRRGLEVIATRAESLSRFLEGYSSLARLPPPEPSQVDLATLVTRVAEAETRTRIAVRAGPPLELLVDAGQIEQLLINVLRNATEASLETGGRVEIGWRLSATSVEIAVDDEGPGVPSSANLFVPFFTTKPNGTGIGLALARQIAEAHGGRLTLENRPEARGCRARLWLPR